MEVYGNVRTKVDIDPEDVIKNLIKDEIGFQGWIFEKDGRYYRGFEVSAGVHSFDEEAEITKEKYEYVKALQLILKNITK